MPNHLPGCSTLQLSHTLPAKTVLRTTGNLYTGNQLPIVVGPSLFTSVVNLFASSIDVRTIGKTGVKEFYYVWDPNLSGAHGLGAYQTFSKSGADYVVTPGSGSYGSSGCVNNCIQSGQAFFVQGTLAGGNLTFQEDAKSSGIMSAPLPKYKPGPELRINLYGVQSNGTTYMADGVFINYDETYSSKVDDLDALKIANGNENISIKNAGNFLAIVRRHSIMERDTLHLNLSRMGTQAYRF